MDEPLEENQTDRADAERIFDQEAVWFSKRQVYRRRRKTANQVIGQLMAKKGFNQNESFEQIKSIWESIQEERMKGQSMATGIRAGKLIVVVKNAVINQELTFNKIALLEKIKNSPIGSKVKDIRFQIGVF